MQIKIEKIKMIGIWVIDFIYVKHIFRQNDASFFSQSVPSLASMQFVSDSFYKLVIFNSVLYLC